MSMPISNSDWLQHRASSQKNGHIFRCTHIAVSSQPQLWTPPNWYRASRGPSVILSLLSLLYYTIKNWLQFLCIVKAAVLKQQISKFYPQILSTEDSFYIYGRPLTEINVIASFCALIMMMKVILIKIKDNWTENDLRSWSHYKWSKITQTYSRNTAS